MFPAELSHQDAEDSLTFFISAGEPSGDLLAAELVEALRQVRPGWKAIGIAGSKMIEAGVEPLATIDDLSVMGFVEVIKHLPHLKLLENELLAQLERRRPKFAVLVDYPGFHMRIAASLKLRGIEVIQYVAPQLWAWGEKRTEKLKRVTDMVLGIMPFEAEFFQERGVNYRYIGTPQVDRVRSRHGQRSQFGMEEGRHYIGFFPGSRWGEVSRIIPKIVGIREELRKKSQELRYTVSIAPSLSLEAFSAFFQNQDLQKVEADILEKNWALYEDTFFVKGSSLELMQVVDAALVTSGTATLECALSETPMAVAYVMNRLSFKIAKHLVKLPHISLVNLVAGQGLIKEFIQDFPPQDVAEELWQMVHDETYRSFLMAELGQLFLKLKGDLASHAAQVICELYGNEMAGLCHSQMGTR